MNVKRLASLHSSFIIPRSSFHQLPPEPPPPKSPPPPKPPPKPPPPPPKPPPLQPLPETPPQPPRPELPRLLNMLLHKSAWSSPPPPPPPPRDAENNRIRMTMMTSIPQQRFFTLAESFFGAGRPRYAIF